jgi:N utilization substance protein A
MRGTRVKNIVRELHGEKIDIIRWHEDIKEFIAAALSPAKIAEIQATPESKQALVLVDDDQLSLAIGKKGQNVRLASKLTGWQLEIQSRSQQAGKPTLRGLQGVGPMMEERLNAAGVTTVEQLAAMTVEQLTAVKGIGEKTAQRLLESAQQALASAAAEPPAAQPPPPEEPAVETPPAEEPPAVEPPPAPSAPPAPESPKQEPQG